MKHLYRLLTGLCAIFATLPANAQVHLISYDYWEDIPRVYPMAFMFTAEWCQPSKAMEDSFNRLAIEYAGRVQFFFVDIDDDPEWAQRWSVPVLPTTYFIYESDLASGEYKWMAQKSSVPISKLRDNIDWMLSNWTLSNLPQPIAYKDCDDDTDPIHVISAALNGDVGSMVALGNYYERDIAVMWYHRAAQHGNADAMYELGKWYYDFDISQTKGVETIIEAAECGSESAIDFLIYAYQYGQRGFPRNTERENYYRRLRSYYR